MNWKQHIRYLIFAHLLICTPYAQKIRCEKPVNKRETIAKSRHPATRTPDLFTGFMTLKVGGE
jgi:hypothetical protein